MMTDADPGIALEILERLQVVDRPTTGGPGVFVQIGIKTSDVKFNLGDAATTSMLSAGDGDTDAV